MPLDYKTIKPISQVEFEGKVRPLSIVAADPNFRKASAEDLSAAEQMLDLRPGVLRDYEFYCTRYFCVCGNPVSIDDFVKTSMIEANHDPSFILHTLLGRKPIVAEAKPVCCAACGALTPMAFNYSTPFYGCSTEEPK